MGHARAHAERLIDASPAAVYEVLADYRVHHPRIMPGSLFSDLHVEEGGVGGGTIFHITLRVLGRRQKLHMEVAEPDPGRVLTETNLDTGVVTEFRVAPGGGASRTHAQISSDWEVDGGPRRLVDRWIAPLLMRRIFAQQLRKLSRYVHTAEPSDDDTQGGR
jgi:hypothetical protein